MDCANQHSLSKYLVELAKDIEENKLSQQEILRISQFKIEFECLREGSSLGSFKKEDHIKFMTLGWHIYTNILGEKTELNINSEQDES